MLDDVGVVVVVVGVAVVGVKLADELLLWVVKRVGVLVVGVGDKRVLKGILIVGIGGGWMLRFC